MSHRPFSFGMALFLVAIPGTLFGQGFPAIDAQTGAAPRMVQPKNVQPKKPGQQLPAETPSDQNPFSSYPGQQTAAPLTATGPKRSVQPDPAATAAQRQTGLSETQARSLLQHQGYGSVTAVEAQPNSVWAWQADAMKNGRHVRLGIDYRGNVLELGGSARPCGIPGTSRMLGGLGVGARLSETTACAGR